MNNILKKHNIYNNNIQIEIPDENKKDNIFKNNKKIIEKIIIILI